MASRSEFESESRPRQGLMIGRYTTGTTNRSYLEALYNHWGKAWIKGLFYSVGTSDMPSKVRVNMRSCGRFALITAESQPDGKVRITIDTDCDNVKRYAELLGGEVSMDDCMDFAASKVFSSDVLMPLTMTCLIPTAVMNAVYMELGMVSKSFAEKGVSNDMVYEM